MKSVGIQEAHSTWRGMVNIRKKSYHLWTRSSKGTITDVGSPESFSGRTGPWVGAVAFGGGAQPLPTYGLAGNE